MAAIHPVQPTRPTEAARLELVRLSPVASPDRVFSRACELAAAALDVDRVGVWLFVEERTALRCANLYERSKNEHSSGAILRVAEFPAYFGALTIRRSIPAEVATDDPRTAELAAAYLRPMGISSMLDAGIFVEGELLGVVCHEHVGAPREWTTEARDFAGSVADLLALKIQGAAAADLRESFRTQQDRLTALDKGEALAQLAAGLAHDFRNILTVIEGQADLLGRRSELPSEALHQVQEVRAAAAHGVVLVRELLEFARPPAATPTVLNLAEATAELVPMIRSVVGSRHPIHFECPLAVGPVLIDKAQYARVLLNLSINAREAMPDGGRIDVRVTPLRVPEGTENAGPYVVLEVTDRGIGMGEATRRRAGEAFFTTKPNGTGLGLAVVRQIADRTGGFVRIDSVPDRGTTIRVFFPRIGAATGNTTEFTVPPEIRSP